MSFTIRPTIAICQLIRTHLKRSTWYGGTSQNQLNRCLSKSATLFTSSILENNNGSRRITGRQREMSETTICVQEGLNIKEVPVAVLRSNPCQNDNEKCPPKPYVNLDPKEEAAFVDGFNNFNSPREVLRLLDTIPSQEVTPVVSLSILRKLFELENNFGFRNDEKSWVITGDHNSIETFARTAIVSRLIDTIISADDSSVLVDTLEVLRCEKRQTQSQSLPWFGQVNIPSTDSLEDFSSYSNRLCNEVLVRTTEGQLSLECVCRAVCSLGQMDRQTPNNFQKRFIDKMWTGIMSKSGNITAENIVQVFSTIPYFTKARRLVVNLVERKMLSLCWKLDVTAVADVSQILVDNEKQTRPYWSLAEDWGLSHRFLICLSRCLNLNLHLVTEEQLSKIVHGFLAMDYCDSSFENVLNKYMKAKSRKITDPNLVASLMTFVKHFRLRTSSSIMEGAAEYLIQHGPELTASQIHSILVPFGILDFQPPNGIKFWETIESVLNEKFIQFSPNAIIEILLTCVYLQKYPLNFVDRVFSPYFLDRLHTSEQDLNYVQRTKSRLKLLDTALALECNSRYFGPILPRDFTSKSIYIDNRIIRSRRILEKFLHTLFPESRFTIDIGIPIPNMPLNELYIIDFIITPKTSSSSSNSTQLLSQENNDSEPERDNVNARVPPASHLPSVSLRNRINLKYSHSQSRDPQCHAIAVLINIPEHFSADGKHLGAQVMRVRHLRALGFSVFTFKFEKLVELYQTPQAFLDYLKETFTSLPGTTS